MTARTRAHTQARRQRGLALVTVLFLMLALLAITVSGVRAGLSAGQAARAERDRLVARAAAEAALRDAESDIEGAAGPTSPRSALFAKPEPDAFHAGCAGSGEYAGLCRRVPPPGVPAWQEADLAGPAGVEYGRFSGRMLPLGAGPLPARAPRYLIELLAVPGATPLYRITALGFGAHPATTVVLQSTYRRAQPASAGGAPALPGARLGWREVANWAELHRAARP